MRQRGAVCAHPEFEVSEKRTEREIDILVLLSAQSPTQI